MEIDKEEIKNEEDNREFSGLFEKPKGMKKKTKKVKKKKLLKKLLKK